MTDINNQPTNEIAGIMHSYLRRLKEDRDKLNAEISLVESKIAGLSSMAEGVQPTGPRRRRPRGANLELVRKAITENPKKQFTVSDLKDATKISGSSVRTALEKLKSENVTEEVSKGYWRAISTT